MWARYSSVGEGTCRSCGQPITWVENAKSKKKLPLDGHDLDWKSRYEGREKGVPVTFVEVDLSRGGTHTSHFSTCPDADDHRRS